MLRLDFREIQVVSRLLTIEELISCRSLVFGLGLGFGLAHLLLAGNDTMAEVCAFLSALWFDLI